MNNEPDPNNPLNSADAVRPLSRYLLDSESAEPITEDSSSACIDRGETTRFALDPFPHASFSPPHFLPKKENQTESLPETSAERIPLAEEIILPIPRILRPFIETEDSSVKEDRTRVDYPLYDGDEPPLPACSEFECAQQIEPQAQFKSQAPSGPPHAELSLPALFSFYSEPEETQSFRIFRFYLELLLRQKN